jgi:hypothetical protein
LTISFEPFNISPIDYSWQAFSFGTKIFNLVTLTLEFDLLFKNGQLNQSRVTVPIKLCCSLIFDWWKILQLEFKTINRRNKWKMFKDVFHFVLCICLFLICCKNWKITQFKWRRIWKCLCISYVLRPRFMFWKWWVYQVFSPNNKEERGELSSSLEIWCLTCSFFLSEYQWHLGLHIWKNTYHGTKNRNVEADQSETECQGGETIYTCNLHAMVSTLILHHSNFWLGLHKMYPAYRLVNAGQDGGRLLIGYLLCAISSSHTFKLTIFKPCTVVMDILKMCM